MQCDVVEAWWCSYWYYPNGFDMDLRHGVKQHVHMRVDVIRKRAFKREVGVVRADTAEAVRPLNLFELQEYRSNQVHIPSHYAPSEGATHVAAMSRGLDEQK